MSLKCLRPFIQDLRFQIFGRPIHPELIESLASKRVSRNGVTVTVRLMAEGHTVEFRTRDKTVTEIVSSTSQPLPTNQLLTEKRLLQSHHLEHVLDENWKFHAGFQAEVLDPEVFQAASEEIVADSQKATLAYSLAAKKRAEITPISYVNIDAVPKAIIVQSFHTYPEERAVLRTQTLLEYLD